MIDIDKKIERRLTKLSGCPSEIQSRLVRAQNDLLAARDSASDHGLMMTEGACGAALDLIRHAIRLCQNGS
jgi:hypothetical protein